MQISTNTSSKILLAIPDMHERNDLQSTSIRYKDINTAPGTHMITVKQSLT